MYLICIFEYTQICFRNIKSDYKSIFINITQDVYKQLKSIFRLYMKIYFKKFTYKTL